MPFYHKLLLTLVCCTSLNIRLSQQESGNVSTTASSADKVLRDKAIETYEKAKKLFDEIFESINKTLSLEENIIPEKLDEPMSNLDLEKAKKIAEENLEKAKKKLAQAEKTLKDKLGNVASSLMLQGEDPEQKEPAADDAKAEQPESSSPSEESDTVLKAREAYEKAKAEAQNAANKVDETIKDGINKTLPSSSSMHYYCPFSIFTSTLFVLWKFYSQYFQ